MYASIRRSMKHRPRLAGVPHAPRTKVCRGAVQLSSRALYSITHILRFGFSESAMLEDVLREHPLLFRPRSILTSVSPRTAIWLMVIGHSNSYAIPESREPDTNLDSLLPHVFAWRRETTGDPWISTTVSLPWIVWEGKRRQGAVLCQWCTRFPSSLMHLP